MASITEYIAFDFDVCKKVKELDPSAIVTYLNGDKSPDELAAAGFDGLDYHYSVYKQHEAWLAIAKKKKLITNVWTVNDAETMRWFIDRKVDYITTNEPERLIELLNKRIKKPFTLFLFCSDNVRGLPRYHFYILLIY